jgi:hypothetical protein
MTWNELRLRLRAVSHRRNFERDVEDEIAFHLAMREQKLREQGMDLGAAQAAAHAGFGNSTRTGEALREMRSWGWVEGIDRFGDVDVYGGGVANVAVAVLAVLVLGFFVERVSSF